MERGPEETKVIVKTMHNHGTCQMSDAHAYRQELSTPKTANMSETVQKYVVKTAQHKRAKISVRNNVTKTRENTKNTTLSVNCKTTRIFIDQSPKAKT